MAKHERLHTDRKITLTINDPLKKRMATLAEGGFLGNTYEDVALMALREGIKELEKQERKAKQFELNLAREDDQSR